MAYANGSTVLFGAQVNMLNNAKIYKHNIEVRSTQEARNHISFRCTIYSNESTDYSTGEEDPSNVLAFQFMRGKQNAVMFEGYIGSITGEVDNAVTPVGWVYHNEIALVASASQGIVCASEYEVWHYSNEEERVIVTDTVTEIIGALSDGDGVSY